MSLEILAELHAARTARIQALGRDMSQRLPAGTAFTLEIGCGHGHYLAAYAESDPERWMLGLDLITRRVEKSRAKRDKRGLQRLHFIKAEAVEFLEALSPALHPLGEVLILFPDPWPKKRHHKNRLIQPEFLELLASRCAPGARMHFRTDHADYYDWALERVSSHDRWKILGPEVWPFEHTTIFQEMMGAHQSLSAEVR